MKSRLIFKFIQLLLLVFAGLTFVGLGLYCVSHNYIFQTWNLSDKGALGDAFNGLTAPFISILSAILIYLTFRAQNKANKLLNYQNRFDIFLKLYDDTEKRIDNLQVQITPELPNEPHITCKGPKSIKFFSENQGAFEQIEEYNYLNNLCLICEDVILLFSYGSELDSNDKLYFIKRLHTLVNLKFDKEMINNIGINYGISSVNPEGLMYDRYLNTLKRFRNTISIISSIDYLSIVQSEESLILDEIKQKKAHSRKLHMYSILNKFNIVFPFLSKLPIIGSFFLRASALAPRK